MTNMGMRMSLPLRGFNISMLIFNLMKILCSDKINLNNITQIHNPLSNNSSRTLRDNFIIKTYLDRILTICSKEYSEELMVSQSFTLLNILSIQVSLMDSNSNNKIQYLEVPIIFSTFLGFLLHQDRDNLNQGALIYLETCKTF